MVKSSNGRRSLLQAIGHFLRLESTSGILLVLAAVVAMVLANSDMAKWYDQLLHTPVMVMIGDFNINKPLLLWINDGLMAVFFFLVGLELKREVMEGELRTLNQIILPGIAALGGMVVPAVVYAVINSGSPDAMRGWAIPTATDIAFALGVLTLLGPRVPTSLKIFLMTLAVFDDVGAIIIIAIFFTTDLSTLSLLVSSGALIVLLIMKRLGVMNVAAYLIVGLVLWASVLKSGVHATLAGVVLALFIPMRHSKKPDYSPLRELEQDLHPPVAYGILPLFAFANAGVVLAGSPFEILQHPIAHGIALGLWFGKQLGVFGSVFLIVKLGWATLPANVNWGQVYGVALLCGIGFTMSLFIGTLAFQEHAQEYAKDVRVGIIFGTLVSAVTGYLMLHFFSPKHAAAQNNNDS